MLKHNMKGISGCLRETATQGKTSKQTNKQEQEKKSQTTESPSLHPRAQLCGVSGEGSSDAFSSCHGPLVG